MAGSEILERGCGVRLRGQVYLETLLGPGGKPVSHYLYDPPVPIDPAAIGLSPLGVLPVEGSDGTIHLLDWVGSQYYPNVADIVEEVRFMGLSRRIRKDFDFSILSRKSRIILVHPHGYIRNWAELVEEDVTWSCPKGNADHSAPIHEHCSGLWWEDVSRDVRRDGGYRDVIRQMPSFFYAGRHAPDTIRLAYQPAMIARFPISRIAVIRDPDDQTHEYPLANLSRSLLPVALVDF